MKINKLKLKKFRNYNDIDLVFNSKVNVFTGENANGKTNILEAIYLSAIGKSFRTSHDIEMIKFGEDISEVIVCAEHENGEKVDVNIKISKQGKMIRVNDIILKKISELFENVYCVIFSPEDLNLIKGEPSSRRRFIDVEISMLKKSYYNELVSYKKVLRQRNALIKSGKPLKEMAMELDIWEEKLAEKCANIMIERAFLIKNLADKAVEIQRNISSGKEKLTIRYKPSINSEALNKLENDERFIKKFYLSGELKEIKEEIKYELKTKISEAFLRVRKRDIVMKTTTIGIHRDDITILINDKEIKKYGSQGQQRTAVLALKLAQLKITKEISGISPVLLLDDVLSELDKERQNYLLSNIDDVQVFITCADFSQNQQDRINPESLFTVEKNEKGDAEVRYV